MGTYTTNYNLFMPTIGEQGWGELVNGNFTTIDTTMKGLDTRMGTAETNITSLTSRVGTAETTITSNKSRIGTLETEADAVEERVTILEKGEFETINADNYVGLPTKYNYTVTPTTSTFDIYPTVGSCVTLICVPFGSTISGTVSGGSGSGNYVNNASLTFAFFKNDGTISTSTATTNVSIPTNTYMIMFRVGAGATNYWTSARVYGLKFVSINPLD